MQRASRSTLLRKLIGVGTETLRQLEARIELALLLCTVAATHIADDDDVHGIEDALSSSLDQ